MAIINIQPPIAIRPLGLYGAVAGSTTLTMDASGESVALVGPIVWKGGVDGDTKVLSAAGGGAIYIPLASAVTFANGSDLTVGLQDLSSGVEDGTFDVSGTYIGGTDTVVASRYNRIPMETGSKTVTYGQYLAIVAELVTRVNPDSIQIEGQTVGTTLVGGTSFAIPYGTQDTGSGPAKRVAPCPYIIEFDDDTLGTCVGYPATLGLRGITASNLNSGSVPDEYANLFTPTVAMRVTGLWAYATNVSSADPFTIHLYSDPLGTPVQERHAAVDVANQAGTGGLYSVFFTGGTALTPYDWTVGAPLALSIRPTSTNNISIFTQDLGTGNELLKQFSDFEAVQLGSRANASGAFDLESTTTILMVGLWVTGLSDNVSAGGGGGLRLAGHGGLAS